VIIDTDGGPTHFKTRISFFFGTKLPSMFGKCGTQHSDSNEINLFFTKKSIPFHWFFSPPYHGKGECDSHGAVVKRTILLFVLDGNFVCVHHVFLTFFR